MTTWNTTLPEWRAWLRAADKSPQSIRLRTHQLQRFANAHPDGPDVTETELIAWLAQPSWATETRRSNRAALRAYYGWAHATGHIEHDPSRNLPTIKPAKHPPRPAPEGVVRTHSDAMTGLA